jgi:hypothetical protein
MTDDNRRSRRLQSLNPEQVLYILHFTRVFEFEDYDDDEEDGENEDDDEEDGENEDDEDWYDEEDNVGGLFQVCVKAAVIESIEASEGYVAPAA